MVRVFSCQGKHGKEFRSNFRIEGWTLSGHIICIPLGKIICSSRGMLSFSFLGSGWTCTGIKSVTFSADSSQVRDSRYFLSWYRTVALSISRYLQDNFCDCLLPLLGICVFLMHQIYALRVCLKRCGWLLNASWNSRSSGIWYRHGWCGHWGRKKKHE